MFKVTALSLLLLLAISTVASLGFLFISVKAFCIVFGIATGVQMFVGYPINRYLEGKEKSLNAYSKLLSEQELFIHTAQTTNIECAYCNTMNNVKVHINNDYRFKCRECGQVSKVVVDTTSCRTTDLEIVEEISDGE